MLGFRSLPYELRAEQRPRSTYSEAVPMNWQGTRIITPFYRTNLLLRFHAAVKAAARFVERGVMQIICTSEFISGAELGEDGR
jgi:hypothetical protein